jgi:hypothetical protein
MNGKFLLVIVFLSLLLTACGPGQQAQGPRDECGLIEPTEADVRYILSFGAETFGSDDWIKSYTVEPYKISLSRTNQVLSGVAFVEYLIFNCGYGQPDLDAYFNDEGFNIIFSEYEAHELANFCEVEDLAFYEYKLLDEGIEFSAHYWVWQATETRLLDFLLVLPKDNPALLDEYSRLLFPDLPSCENSTP